MNCHCVSTRGRFIRVSARGPDRCRACSLFDESCGHFHTAPPDMVLGFPRVRGGLLTLNIGEIAEQLCCRWSDFRDTFTTSRQTVVWQKTRKKKKKKDAVYCVCISLFTRSVPEVRQTRRGRGHCLLEQSPSEMLKVQLVRFPAYYGTQEFIVVLTRRVSFPVLSQMSPNHSIPPDFFKVHSGFMSTPSLRRCIFPVRVSQQNPVCISPVPHTATWPAHLILDLTEAEETVGLDIIWRSRDARIPNCLVNDTYRAPPLQILLYCCHCQRSVCA